MSFPPRGRRFNPQSPAQPPWTMLPYRWMPALSSARMCPPPSPASFRNVQLIPTSREALLSASAREASRRRLHSLRPGARHLRSGGGAQRYLPGLREELHDEHESRALFRDRRSGGWFERHPLLAGESAGIDLGPTAFGACAGRALVGCLTQIVSRLRCHHAGARKTTARSTLRLSWFATDGKFDHDITGRDENDPALDATNRWVGAAAFRYGAFLDRPARQPGRRRLRRI